MKTCKKCLKSKTLAEFERNSGCIDGYTGSCKDCRNKSRRVRRKIHGHKDTGQRKHKLLKLGWTPERWAIFNYAQGGLCYLCGESDYTQGINRRLQSDHCHESGKPRGLLCTKCNVRLSWAEKIGLLSLFHYLGG